jgi:hypothetical protein
MSCRRLPLAVLLVAGLAGPARAQERAVAPAEPERAEGELEAVAAEAEFAASTIYQTAFSSLRMGSPLRLDLRYFGVEENDIGMVGASWELRLGGLRLLPGAAWAFGRENRPAPVLTLRWAFENEHVVSQGTWVQSLRAHLPEQGEHDAAEHESEEVVRHAGVFDGVHVSARFGRLDVGPMVEHIRYREENEWKGGVRVAWRVARGLRVGGHVVAPDPEVRVGLTWER